MIAQDLLMCEIEFFYLHNVLELAITSESYEFVCLVPVQQLLTDVWYDKISSHVSGWQVCGDLSVCAFKLIYEFISKFMIYHQDDIAVPIFSESSLTRRLL